MDAFKYLGTARIARSTVVYADPPYDFGRYDELLAALDASEPNGDALIAVEHRRNTDLASETNHLALTRRAEYGEVRISIYAVQGD